MREIEKTYDNLESREWRQELVEMLSLVVYEYLKREGLLRRDGKVTEGDREATEHAAPPTEPGGRRGEIMQQKVWAFRRRAYSNSRAQALRIYTRHT